RKIKRLQEGAKELIQYRVQAQPILDSAVVKKNKITYHETVSEPEPARLRVASNGGNMEILKEKAEEPAKNSIYLARGVIKFEGTDFVTAKGKGNAINNVYSKYKTQSEEMYSCFADLDAEYEAASDEQKQSETFLRELETKAESLYKKHQHLDEEFVKSNPNNYISLAILDEIVSAENLIDLVKPEYERMSSNLKETELG